jgi:hypothetical protein
LGAHTGAPLRDPQGQTASPVETHGRASPLRVAGSPERAAYPSPGQRPGLHSKYRVRPVGAVWLSWSSYPGRCPGLGYAALSGLPAMRGGDAKHRVSTGMPYNWRVLRGPKGLIFVTAGQRPADGTPPQPPPEGWYISVAVPPFGRFRVWCPIRRPLARGYEDWALRAT